MSRRTIPNLLLVVGAALCLVIALPPPSVADPVEELYLLSGAHDSAIQSKRTFEVILSAHQDDYPPRVHRALVAAVRETVDTTRLDSTFLAHMRGELSEPTTKAALSFLRTPTGRTIADAERRSSTPESVLRLEAFLENAPAESDPARVSLLRILDAATGVSDMLASQSLVLQYAVAVAFDSARPEDERQGGDVLWALIQQGEAQTEYEAHQKSLATFLFTYRSITKAELRKYIEFAISDQGLEYHRIMVKVTTEILTDLYRSLAMAATREMLRE